MRAHESAQQDEGREGSWVHAYLHRKDGDQSNAAYWYVRAGANGLFNANDEADAGGWLFDNRWSC